MTDYTDLLATLEKVQQHDYAIFRLSESIATVSPKDNADLTRTSDVSNAFDSSTPTALQADLIHYKVTKPKNLPHHLPNPLTNTPQELFSKLRFSYLEQVTKEKFLRAITEDPPVVIEPSENEALEQELTSAKANLWKSKADVDNILKALEELSQKLATEHKVVSEYTSLARTLPGEAVVLEARIEELRREQESMTGEFHLPLEDTLGLVAEREAELARLERELEEVGRELPRKRRALEVLDKEISPMEMDKEGLEKFANEAVKMRDSARAEGKADRETMGRWYKSVFEGLEALLPDKG